MHRGACGQAVIDEDDNPSARVRGWAIATVEPFRRFNSCCSSATTDSIMDSGICNSRTMSLLSTRTPPALVGNPIRLASGAGDAYPDGQRSHTAVDCTDQLVSLKSAT